jgi:hypothetical protein
LPRVVATLGKTRFDPTWKSAFGTVLNQTAPCGTCSDLVDNESTFKEQPYDVRSQYDWFQLRFFFTRIWSSGIGKIIYMN